MKNKANNSYNSNQSGSSKSSYHKSRTNNYYKKNYSHYYKSNSNNGYYDRNYSQKENFDYIEHSNYENNRNYYKKNKWYNKKYDNEIYDDEDAFAYLDSNSRNYAKYTESNDNTNTSSNKEIKKEEVLKVNIKVNGEVKEITVYKNDDVKGIGEKFCKENRIEGRLVKAIAERLKRSIESIDLIVNNKLSERDIKLIKNIKELYNKTNNKTGD